MKEQSQPPAEAVPKFSSFRPCLQSHRTSAADSKSPHLSISVSAKPNDDVKNSPATTPQTTPQPKDPKTEAYHVRGQHLGSPHSKRHKQHHASALSSTEATSQSDQQRFIADWLGDDANSKYGSPNPRTVSAYQRFESREVLGSVFDKVAIASSDGKGVILTSRWLEGQGFSDKNTLSQLTKDKKKELDKVLICRPNATSNFATDANLDYVPFMSEQSMKGHSETHTSREKSSLHNEHLDMSAFRSDHHVRIDAKGSNDPEDISNLKEFEDSSLVDHSLGHRRRDLEMAVEADPASLDNWINLISFQDEQINKGDRLHGDEPSRAEKHSNADIKTTLYEKAIKKVQTLNHKEVLLQGMMRAGSTIWEANKLSRKWQNVLREYPTSILLKVDYLNYIESASSLVSVEEICKVYHDCLDLLHECRTSKGADNGNLYVKQVYVTLRMTLFLQKAGFSEHAIAIWQALLEYEFYMPANLEDSRYRMSKESKLDLRSAFEDFWESELPRIGEPDAQGWSHYQADHEVSVDPRTDIVPTSLGSFDQFEAWGQAERSHSLNSQYPARTVDDVNKNDPYRVILFPDVKNFLIKSPTEIGRRVLVDALFCFCHMPPSLSRTFDDGPSLWFGDPFTRNETLYGDQRSVLQWPEQKYQNSETGDVSKLRSSCSPFTLPVQDYFLTTDTLFTAKENWFSAFNAWNTKTQSVTEPVNVFWIYRVMAMLLQTGKLGERFVEYYLAFEMEISPEVARKSAKALLKTQPSNLRLYNTYALVEYRLGNVGTADKVIRKAWAMRNKLDKDEVCNMVSLCRTRTWQRLESSQSLDALQGIVEFAIGPVEDAAPSTLMTERGTHAYESTTARLRAQTVTLAAITRQEPS
ncbi:MAG: hypothetical protein Q9167_000376 [Letrouitia subvulpina]